MAKELLTKQAGTLAIVQARTSSTRLPGKVLMPLGNTPMILYQLKRIEKSELIDKIVVATSTDRSDDELVRTVRSAGFDTYRGPLDDVLERFRGCAERESAKTVVRLTGDCPFTDPVLIDELISQFRERSCDYISNNAEGDQLSVPDGFDVEVFTADLLKRAASEADLPSEREHVTPWMRKTENRFIWTHFRHSPVRPYFRVTVDDEKDFWVAREIIDAESKSGRSFGVDDVVDFLLKNPKIAAKNLATIRNEGYLKSLEEDRSYVERIERGYEAGQGQALWRRAKTVIPGGNMLLSKRAEMFLPDAWPAYFSRAKGCKIWDLEGRELVDMSIMGIGTNLLGYGHPEVDSAVAATVAAGNMSTLNCPEEVWLAERLVEIHPWADMVRFARTGGEANAIAIRIARAATGRETVAICGYHGWHDWYLAANLETVDGLDQHLLPGLEANGVPHGLEGSVKTFRYNCFKEVREIAANSNLAAIKMEVQRTTPPNAGFLEGIRELCDEHGIVLIFDECTSGFRETFGGLHKKYGVEPDMAMFGKALGNGYAITATIGRREVMEAAQTTFISSTFWTERIGPSAALKTLEVMEREKSWEKVTEIGQAVQKGWHGLAKRQGLDIETSGLAALCTFRFMSRNHLKYKTLITQEMLRKGYLASTSFYASLAHTPQVVEEYLEELSRIFDVIGECENGLNIDDLLESPICHEGFKRLN